MSQHHFSSLREQWEYEGLAFFFSKFGFSKTFSILSTFYIFAVIYLKLR